MTDLGGAGILPALALIGSICPIQADLAYDYTHV
jgi:hypothetical protein